LVQASTHCLFFRSLEDDQHQKPWCRSVCIMQWLASALDQYHQSCSALCALVGVAHLWQLLQQSFLLDRRNASNDRHCPDTTNLTNTLQMLTHLHMHRKYILVPAIACSDAYSLYCTSLAALHLSANQCQFVEQSITL